METITKLRNIRKQINLHGREFKTGVIRGRYCNKSKLIQYGGTKFKHELFLTFLFVQFLSPPIYAQVSERLDTKEITCNKAWFDDFKEISDTAEKIKAIGLKIAQTSNEQEIEDKNRNKIKIRGSNAIRYESSLENRSEPKILLKLKDYFYTIDKNVNTKSNEVIQLLSERNVKEIITLNAKIAEIIYGSSSKCGLVLIVSEDDKLGKDIKELHKQ